MEELLRKIKTSAPDNAALQGLDEDLLKILVQVEANGGESLASARARSTVALRLDDGGDDGMVLAESARDPGVVHLLPQAGGPVDDERRVQRSAASLLAQELGHRTPWSRTDDHQTRCGSRLEQDASGQMGEMLTVHLDLHQDLQQLLVGSLLRHSKR